MIIGVTGPICSGTTTFMDFLKDKGFQDFSYSDVLRDMMKEQGIPLERINIINFANELRMKQGSGVLSKILLSKMKDGNYVVGNIRNPGEVEVFKNSEKKFSLVKIDAPVETRFERAKARNRENEPANNFEEFKKLDDLDHGKGQDESGQQHGKVFDMADYVLVNDSRQEEFKKNINGFLEPIS